MAKPIKETPILKGKDAVVFLNNLSTSNEQKISKKDAVRIKQNFLKLQSISKF